MLIYVPPPSAAMRPVCGKDPARTIYSKKDLAKMKIIVFSDSHGNTGAISRALKKNADGLDMCVFLGDGTDDAEYALSSYPSVKRIIVSGNREEYFSSFFGLPYPIQEEFEIQGIRFLALHGHRPVNVKGGLGAAASYAASKGADVLLYGHTHIKNVTVIETASGKVRLINPGTCGSGHDLSYALLTIIDGVILCGFGEI